MRANAFLTLMPAALLALAGCTENQSPTSMAAPNAASTQLMPGPATSPGIIVAWGADDEGQVSDAPSGNDFVAVAGGIQHGVALREDGTLAAWGLDGARRVVHTPTGNDFVAVTAGAAHNIALREDGSLIAWGWNDDGQVSRTPAESDFVAVAGGRLHSIALREDGSLVSWGGDLDGQVVETPTANDFVAVAGGGFHSVALRDDGSLVSWGSNRFGQVRETPTESGFIAVAAGGDHSIALRDDGSLVAWGLNDDRQVSDTPSGNDFVAVAAGGRHSIALRDDGSLVSWGRTDHGQVSGTPSGNDFVAVAAGFRASYAIQVSSVDELPPVVSVTSPADSAVYLLGQEVIAEYACTDEDGGSGLASCTGSVANASPINTGEAGTMTFVVEASDSAGNTATLTHTYTVAYDFHGFLPPVKNDGEFNKANAGQTIPLKWRLRDANGKPITDLTGVDVTVEDVSCERAGSHDWKKAGAAGWTWWKKWKKWWPPTWRDRDGGWHGKREGLKHLGHGYYRYNWKTRKDYARSCKALHLDLGDGVTHTALFNFSR